MFHDAVESGGRLAEGSTVIDVHMGNIRDKLRDVGVYRLLRTVRGTGYALREEVQPDIQPGGR